MHLITGIFFDNNQFMEMIVTIAIIYAVTFAFFVERIKEAKLVKKKKFIKALYSGLKNNSIKNLDDITNIYKGISSLDSDDPRLRNEISKYLREFLVDIISKKVDSPFYIGKSWRDSFLSLVNEVNKYLSFKDSFLDYDVISEKVDEPLYPEQYIEDSILLDWKNKITNFIEINDKSFPYSDMPTAERNILNDISVFIENNDKLSTQRKISELASMIQVRNDDLNKIREMNRWSIPLATIGFILTVISTAVAFIK